MGLSARTFEAALRRTSQSFANNPATLFVVLGGVVLTTFFRCVFFGCNLFTGSGWVFFSEIIVPGIVVGLIVVFLWNLWRSRRV
jgi:hypothetical protein